jgi:cytochrome b6-f complex iron-sulfur subunit/menaquinol-cytochrome c reductase iron-sulfur subunit
VKIVSDVRDAWKLEKDADLGAVWLIRTGGAVRALSVVCPHLGCSIGVRDVPPSAGPSTGATEDKKGFACPCHDSSFSIDGKRQDGPSPRDMDSLATRITDGVVEIDFRRFRQGTPERIEVG